MMIELLEGRRLLSAIRFAVIGDYGTTSAASAQVARRVARMRPELVLTVGDNNYPSGSGRTIDRNIGTYYQQYIYPYRGRYGPGAADGVNRFFPALGNHDWEGGDIRPYLRYFKLPGNERYYSFRRGPVQFFALDSDPSEPDLRFVDDSTSTVRSPQARWLRRALTYSTARWKVVYFHHAPYSSDAGLGSSEWMRWPFKQWGASAVIAGHAHNYERLNIGGLPYFVNGSGGAEQGGLGTRLRGSQAGYDEDYGAMLVEADEMRMRFRFVTRGGVTVDDYTIGGKRSARSAVMLTGRREVMVGTFLAGGCFAVKRVMGQLEEDPHPSPLPRGEGEEADRQKPVL